LESRSAGEEMVRELQEPCGLGLEGAMLRLHRDIWIRVCGLSAIALVGCAGSGSGGFNSSTPPVPWYGPTVSLATSPPPISGGTMIVLKKGGVAVASEPDRDAVYVVSLSEKRVTAAVALQPQDEPGRLVEDGAGRVHVALRRGGALVTINPSSGQAIERRAVCPAPRGVAWEAATDRVHVACAGGELVSLPAAGGPATRTVQLDRDLRDVVVDGGALLVSRFRSAELLVVDSNGAVTGRRAPDKFASSAVRNGTPFAPTVAWRTIAMPSGGVLMAHQRGMSDLVGTSPPKYYASSGFGLSGPCDGAILHTAVTRLGRDGRQLQPSPPMITSVLPVDLAVSPDERTFALISAGNWQVPGRPRLQLVEAAAYVGKVDCLDGDSDRTTVEMGAGQPIAVAFDPASGEPVVQTREPSSVQLPRLGVLVPLSNEAAEDTGHHVFHTNSGGDIACASCHAEGGDDGHVWVFVEGKRRTQSLLAGVAAVGPYHWLGDIGDFPQLVDQIFVGRMAGPQLGLDQQQALGTWVGKIPRVAPSPGEPGAVARGRAIFEDPTVGCATCHSGEELTDRKIADVGTEGDGYGQSSFKVPSLIGLSLRAPYLHNGCAPTLRDRFGACGGKAHGSTSQLSEAQLTDLIRYLESL
jgi:hypothetical protein